MNITLNPLKLIKNKIKWFEEYRFDTGFVFGTYYLIGVIFALFSVENAFKYLSKIIVGFISVYSIAFFACFINDIFDAPYDALNDKKSSRNLFCGKFQKNREIPYFLIIIILIISLFTSWVLGSLIFSVIIIALLGGFFYSAPPIRFKTRPPFDLIIHGIIGGGNLILIGYVILKEFDLFCLILYFFAFFDSIWMQLTNQLRDFNTDRDGVQYTTAVKLGFDKGIKLLLYIIMATIISLGIAIAIQFAKIKLDYNILTKYIIISFFLILTIMIIFNLNSRNILNKLECYTNFRNLTIHFLLFWLFILVVFIHFE